MEKTPETVTRGPPEPTDGLNVHQAAPIIGISERTLSEWLKRGSTPFGFDLRDAQCVPVTHHRRSTQTPRRFIQSRFLIPVATVEALRDILREAPRRPGPINREDMRALEAATRRSRSSLSHSVNSPAP